MGFENPSDFVVSSDEKRKSSKPLMEKRRRARINQSLNELKNLILEALKKDTSCYSKLEKADILEMTVKYLRSLKTSQTTAAPPMQDYDALSKYRAGFNECANEVSRYLMSLNGLDAQMRAKMLSHLADHCSPAKPSDLQETVHRTQILPQPPNPAISLVSSNTSSLLSPTVFSARREPLPGALNGSTQFQLVPGQLADGKIAAVLIPSQNPPLPVLPTSPQIFPLFKPTPSDLRASLQAFQFPAHALRSDSDPLWRPW